MKRLYFQVSHPEGGPWVCDPSDLVQFLVDLTDIHADTIYDPAFSFSVTPVHLTALEFQALPQWKNV